ncbi:MAG TPA: HupE/UreJ family protein, partial [Vicinamibacterales bacterium]
MRQLAVLLVSLGIFLRPAAADAHPAPFTYLDLRMEQAAITGTLIVHIFDVGHDLNIEPPDRLLDPSVAAQQAAATMALLAPRITLAVDGRRLTAAWSDVEPVPDRQSLRLRVRYALASPPGRVTINLRLFPYDPAHQTFINMYEGTALTQAILDDAHTEFMYYSGSPRGTFAVARTLVPEGIRHIVVGPDHLIFLLGLLLLGGSLFHLALIATAFTAGHVLTLTLASFNVVNPSLRLVEPAIALSIVYVGADNLIVSGPGGGRDVRAWIAFTFGFIHGFGFANVLRSMNLPPRALASAIGAFNVGIEIGQLAVVFAMASALILLKSRSEEASRRLAVAGSIIVIAAGAFWFV